MKSLFSLLSGFGRWYDAALLLAALAIIAWYFVSYARALRPRAGTLEWIGMHDRPAFSLSGRRSPLRRGDALPLVLAVLLPAAVWGSTALHTLLGSYPGGAVPRDTALSVAVSYCVLPAVTGAAAYVLLKNLFGSTRTALLGCLLLALDLTASPISAAAVTLSSVFFWRFLTTEYGASFGASCPDLVLAAAVLAAGRYFDPALAVFAAAGLVFLVMGGLFRFRAGFRGRTAVSLLVFLLVFAAVTALLYLPAAVVGGWPFPALLAPVTADGGSFYRDVVWARLVRDYTGFFSLSAAADAPALLRFDWPLLLTGLLAVLASLLAAIRRRAPQGPFLCIGFAALAVMWLLSGSYALPVFCAGGLCFVWSELERRGQRTLEWLGAGCLILMLLVLCVLSWLF